MSFNEFSFKGSGIKYSDREFKDLSSKVVNNPIGIKTPLEMGSGNSDFLKMHFNPADQIRDNLRNLILTNYGERLGRSTLGANLREILFDMSSFPDFEQEINMRINRAVDQYLPFVSIKETASRSPSSARGVNANNLSTLAGDSTGLTAITVTVIYDVPKLSLVNQGVEVTVYVGG